MKIKNLIIPICLIGILAVGVIALRGKNIPFISRQAQSAATTTTSVQFVDSTITVGGAVVAQSQAKLNFQTSGKLIYLPFKEGDAVSMGQTIAQLDSYQLQRQLTAALNTYRSTRDTFDQTQQNAQDNVMNPQMASTYAKVNIDNSTAINDAIKRIVDQNQATLDNSVINVELASYALQLSRLTSPLTGIITHEDVTVSGVNITPATTFTVADPDTMVFRANVPMGSIYYISEGSKVVLAVDGIQNKIQGVVTKIYPSKVTLASGQSVYQVDIESDELKKQGKLDEAGSAIISMNAHNVALVPAWTVLAGTYIWVDINGTPEVRKITVGKIHGNQIEVTNGLSLDDKIIIDPKFIAAHIYKML